MNEVPDNKRLGQEIEAFSFEHAALSCAKNILIGLGVIGLVIGLIVNRSTIYSALTLVLTNIGYALSFGGHIALAIPVMYFFIALSLWCICVVAKLRKTNDAAVVKALRYCNTAQLDAKKLQAQEDTIKSLVLCSRASVIAWIITFLSVGILPEASAILPPYWAVALGISVPIGFVTTVLSIAQDVNKEA